MTTKTTTNKQNGTSKAVSSQKKLCGEEIDIIEWNDRWNVYNEKNETTRDKPLFKSCEEYIILPFAFFIFVIVAGLGILSRLTLHIMIWHIHPPKLNDSSIVSSFGGLLKHDNSSCLDVDCQLLVDEEWVWALFAVIVTPFIFCVFSSLRSVFRKKDEKLKCHDRRGKFSYSIFKTYVFVLACDILDTVGVCLMVFVVLPSFDPATSSIVYLFVGFVPVLFNFVNVTKDLACFGSCKQKKENRSSVEQKGRIDTENDRNIKSLFLHFVGSCLGFVLRFSGFVCIVVYAGNGKITNTLIISTFFSGCRYYENFSGILPHSYNRTIHKNRTWLVLVSNIVKIVVTLVTVIMVFSNKSTDSAEGINALFGHGVSTIVESSEELKLGDDPSCANYVPFILALVNILSSLCLYKAAKIACVIECQIFCFSIPLIVIIPLGTVLVLIHLLVSSDSLNVQSCDLFFSKWNLSSVAEIGEVWQLIAVAFCLVIISYFFSYRHVILTNGKKQGVTRRLFVWPYYCGIFTDICMLLNRRKNDLDFDRLEDETETHTAAEQQLNDPIESSTIPKIYACATMWHETSTEMTQLLTSIFRMDKHQKACKVDLKKVLRDDIPLNIEDVTLLNNGIRSDLINSIYLPDSSHHVEQDKIRYTGYQYDFEAHIFFDDAFEKDKDKTLFPKINEYVLTLIKIIPPAISAVWRRRYKVPNETFKTPYGGRIEWTLPGGTKLIAHLKDKTKIRARKRWSQVMYMYYLLGFKESFKPGIKNIKAENTFLLALDGDVDFDAGAVIHLLNRMKKDKRVGAACGRIHPIGSGVMVWYQKFEYAISHWLMKATEHVTGCVLCSPGCFSMFRASSLIDTNVMRTYTTEPSEAMHYVQYDQGEDRWLCTLLLKQGYRIDYCAESDALTYAPEGFFDFYKQRRRWTPSTMANIMDLLKDSTLVIRKNNDISRLYIIYQILLFGSSVLTPGTIFLLIVGALLIGFPDISSMLGLFINLVPIVLFMVSCIFAKESTQLMFAAVLSAIYAIVMLIVLLGLMKTSLADGFCSSTTVIFCFVGGVFVISAILHPEEGSCLIHGLLFFILIPSMSMLMFLYSLGNLNNVNWGTREKNSGQAEKSLLQTIVEGYRKCCRPTDVSPQPAYGNQADKQNSHDKNGGSNEDDNDSSNPDPTVLGCDCKFETKVKDDEVQFWLGLIKSYLNPKELSETQKKQLQEELKQLRNTACIMVFLSNAILVVIVYTLSKAEAFNKSLVLRFTCGDGKEILIEPLSVLFTAVFGFLLLIQFIGMLYHRFSTIIHITAESSICGRNEVLESRLLAESLLDPEIASAREDSKDSFDLVKSSQRKVAPSAEEQTLNLDLVLKRNVKSAKSRPETLGPRQKTLINILKEINEKPNTPISDQNRDKHIV